MASEKESAKKSGVSEVPKEAKVSAIHCKGGECGWGGHWLNCPEHRECGECGAPLLPWGRDWHPPHPTADALKECTTAHCNYACLLEEYVGGDCPLCGEPL